MTFRKRQNYKDRKQTNGCQQSEVEEGFDNKRTAKSLCFFPSWGDGTVLNPDCGVCVYSVTQLCPFLSDPRDCSPPGSSVHGFPRSEYWSGWPFPPQGDLPDQGSDLVPAPPALQVDSLPLTHRGYTNLQMR